MGRGAGGWVGLGACLPASESVYPAPASASATAVVTTVASSLLGVPTAEPLRVASEPRAVLSSSLPARLPQAPQSLSSQAACPPHPEPTTSKRPEDLPLPSPPSPEDPDLPDSPTMGNAGAAARRCTEAMDGDGYLENDPYGKMGFMMICIFNYWATKVVLSLPVLM
ncbi:uncharacterized protein LOC144457716 [Phascolarctos cinereus]